jgi:acyl-CoA synthetase (AMP-forming)/AMP-acid ligase II
VGRSFARGAPASWPDRTLLTLLLEAESVQRPWLTFHGDSRCDELRFDEAVRLARRWARALDAAGVGAGDQVALFLPNSADFVGAFFGAQWLGACAVPVPWPASALSTTLPPGAQALLDACGARVVCGPRGLDVAGRVMLSAPADTPIETPPFEGRVAFLQYSSGSTGRPRGAVISPRAAAFSAMAMADALELTHVDVGVSWLPFFHDMGLVGVVLTSLAARFRVHVLAPGAFLLRPARWLELVSHVRATMTVAPNFAYELVLRRVPLPGRSSTAAGAPARLDLSSVRAMLNGSEPVHRSTVSRFEQAWAVAGLRAGVIRPVYGLAENVLGVAFGEGGDRADLEFEGRVIPSVGRPLRGLEVAVRDERGEVVEDGVEGTIAVRGPTLMRGYFDDAEHTARTLVEGWLLTGDRGVMRDGRLFITGRDKELIIKAGRKFHPADIERVVAEIADPPPNGVVAFAVTDEARAQESLVVVVEQRRAVPEGLIERIRGRVSTELGVMVDRVELVGAGALPRTTSGKLRRAECSARFRCPMETLAASAGDASGPRQGGGRP